MTQNTTGAEDQKRWFGPATNSNRFSYESLVQIVRFWVPESPGAFWAVFGPARNRSSRWPVTEDQEASPETSHDDKKYEDDDDYDNDNDDDDKDNDDNDDDDDAYECNIM